MWTFQERYELVFRLVLEAFCMGAFMASLTFHDASPFYSRKAAAALSQLEQHYL